MHSNVSDEMEWNGSQVVLGLERLFWTDNNGEDYPPTNSASNAPFAQTGKFEERGQSERTEMVGSRVACSLTYQCGLPPSIPSLLPGGGEQGDVGRQDSQSNQASSTSGLPGVSRKDEAQVWRLGENWQRYALAKESSRTGRSILLPCRQARMARRDAAVRSLLGNGTWQVHTMGQ
jgi:hypothetical protein